jgi:hypothetical protein
MSRLALLLTTLALSVAFVFVDPNGPEKSFFPFSDTKIHADTYVYSLCEHIILILLALVIHELEPKYRLAVTAFLVIHIIDTLDYILFNGENWSPNFPNWLTWNFLKMGFMGAVIFIEQNHNGKKI